MGRASRFLNELRRRNVLRAAVLYVGGAWALAQGVAQLAPVVGAPDWLARWVLIALVIGFPFFVVFAWFYEFTPQGLKLESEVDPADSIGKSTGRKFDFAIIGVLAVAVVLLLTNQFVVRHGEDPRVATVPEDSIAVLPFTDLSPKQDQEYFAEGISEDMLNLLARVPQLKVISRASSFSFKGKSLPLKVIAKTLGVAYVLEGSVQRAGEVLRISAQLVDARHDRNVWSQRWDRKLDDVFKIQDDIAGAVVAQLKLTLLGKVQEINPVAYAEYLQARQLGRQSTRESYQQAIPLFQKVLAKAPDYAPAWHELANIYINQAGAGLRPVDEGVRLARNAINKALAAKPDYATGHADLGWLDMTFDGDLASAAQQFQKALALDPGNPDILGNAAGLAQALGRSDLAISLTKASLVLDPISATGNFNLGVSYYDAHKPDLAIASYRTALRLSPDFIGGRAQLAMALVQKDDLKAALATAQKEPEAFWRQQALAIVYHALGRRQDADAALAELIAKYEKDGSYNIAFVLAYRGEADRAFAWLDKAQAYGDPGLAAIASEPLFDKLHQDSRWLPLLRKLGKAPEQLDKIPFHVKLPAQTGSLPTPRAVAE